MTQSPDNQAPKKDILASIPKLEPSVETKKESRQTSHPVSGKKIAPTSEAPPALDATRKEKTLRALWTITAVISMTVNVIVIIVLALLVQTYSKNVSTFELPAGISVDTPKDFLQGLYDNFQLMDEAHIKTDIVVEDTIPVQFDLTLNQPTTVTLTEPVTIYGAYVEINTGALNISAPATVVLPEGLDLPILLDLVVPVDTTIPVKLNVAVDIPLEETDLHAPFAALKEVVRPLYCLVAPDALSVDGKVVCP